jgi:hypothetical protein
MDTLSREDTTLEAPLPQSLVSSHHADSVIVHQSGSSQVPTNLSFVASTDKSTTLFFESELTCVGRRRKCRDMSGLSLCLCGDSARLDDAGSIRCQRAGCETVWVSFTSDPFRILIDNDTCSTTFNASGTRTHDQDHGLVRPVH